MKPPHDLKCYPEPFRAMARGLKTFEFRKNDRDFELDDLLRLREWSPDSLRGWNAFGGYSGASVLVRVTYLLHGPAFGVPEGYVVMSVVRIDDAAASSSA